MRISDWSSDVCSSDLVGPGDFMGFTAPSPGHHLVNPYQEDLVYLMGGERSGLEIGRFPRAGKTIIFDGQRMHAVDDGARREMSFGDYLPDGLPEAFSAPPAAKPE